MDIIDIIILIIILSFAVVGFKRGVFQSLVAVLGFFVVIYLAYAFKNVFGDFFVLNLPFTKYAFVPGGSMMLNVVAYESIAFIVLLVILGIIYKILLIASGIFEKLLKITIILGIPSKLLGLVIGALEGFVIAYFGLYIVTQPFIRVNLIENSKYAEKILKETPILSKFADDSMAVVNEIEDTIKSGSEENFDLKLTDLILKRKITSAEVIQKLVDKKKVDMVGIQEVIDKYK